MTTKPKKKRSYVGGAVQISATIPMSMKTEINELLRDPVTGRLEYGAQSHLITRLLRNWIAEKKGTEENDRDAEPLDLGNF